jgi:hypothetical protein
VPRYAGFSFSATRFCENLLAVSLLILVFSGLGLPWYVVVMLLAAVAVAVAFVTR